MTSEIFINNTNVCCVSDVHIGVHQNSSVWHNIALKWARWLASELKSNDIRDIIISGDFFHYRDDIAVNTIDFASQLLEEWADFNIVMLVGNHDAYYKDKSDVNSLSILDGWSNITVISKPTTAVIFGKTVTFCPWGTRSHEIPKSDLVFGHFEIRNFKQNIFKVCDDGVPADELLDKCGLIISGHFHLRDEREYSNGRILYLGNPYQMDFGDIENKKGYYILDFNNLSYEFTPNNISPEHYKIHLSELAKAGKLTDEVRDRFENNFIKFVIDKNISPDEVDLVLRKFMSLKPVHINVDYAINFSQFAVDDSKIQDFSGVDVATAIEEFINLMEIDHKNEVVKHTIELYKKCL